MRIFKSCNNIYSVIAGEMLNFEMSKLHFIDGVPAVIGKNVTQEEYNGYPKIVCDNVSYTFSVGCGFVFVPANANVAEIGERLGEAIERLEAQLADSTGLVAPLSAFHTFSHGSHTNIKARVCADARGATVRIDTDRFSQLSPLQKFGTFKCASRLIHTSAAGSSPARFEWVVLPITKLNFEIARDGISNAIGHHIASIFYDAENVSNYKHGEFVHTVKAERFRAHERITGERIYFSSLVHPLLVDNNTYWRSQHKGANKFNFRYEIDMDIYVGNFSDFKVDTKCSLCESPVYGDNYIHERDGDCVVICPICAHLPHPKLDLELGTLYRVTFPRSYADSVFDPLMSAERNAIRALLAANRVTETVNGNVLIGDDFIHYPHHNDYLFHAPDAPDRAQRRIVELVM